MRAKDSREGGVDKTKGPSSNLLFHLRLERNDGGSTREQLRKEIFWIIHAPTNHIDKR